MHHNLHYASHNFNIIDLLLKLKYFEAENCLILLCVAFYIVTWCDIATDQGSMRDNALFV